jgi:hypothetical protein
MWYFTLKQDDLEPEPYRALQQLAVQTEVDIMNEPYANCCVFEVGRADYGAFVDFLDRHGLPYQAGSHRPTRDELRAMML